MKCTICGKPIKLVPSAEYRAFKYGGVPSDYTKLFTAHSECALKKYQEDRSALMEQHMREHEKLMALRVTYPKR